MAQRIKVVEAEKAKLDKIVMRATMRAICPVTGLTDIYEVEVVYKPSSTRYIEAYSFERFLHSFEERRILQEEAASEIAEAICSTGAAKEVTVRVKGSHGGVELETIKMARCVEGEKDNV